MTPSDPFYVGFAISTWQNSGDGKTRSNWGEWCKTRTFCFLPTIAGGAVCGESSDFWNRYKEDIDRAVNLGSNCFRFSLEWHRIEPEQGQIDRQAVQHYIEIIDYLIEKKLEPFVTLHHFVHPLWFEKLGGFTKEENIAYFVEFSRQAFRFFGDRVRFWTTFNEPGVASFAGFVHGSFPPGCIARLWRAGHNMLNMLRAHTQAYAAIRAEPRGGTAIIGLVHNWFKFEPQRAWYTPFYVKWLSAFLNNLWGNERVATYLKSGKYEYAPLGPWLWPLTFEEPTAPGCDYFGLNYYSKGVMDWKLQPSYSTGEIMTDMPYALWPAGLGIALDDIGAIMGKDFPIYITETGAADNGDKVREQCVESYMAAAEEALRKEKPLKGVMWWTLIDNFEWQMGWGMRFGIFEWNPDGTQARILKKSGAALKGWFKRLRDVAVPAVLANDDTTIKEMQPQLAFAH